MNNILYKDLAKNLIKSKKIIVLFSLFITATIFFFVTKNSSISAATSTCTDLDGGQDAFVSSSVEGVSPSGYSYVRYDVCQTGVDEGYLKEMICVDGVPQGRKIYCEYGCLDGACVNPDITPTPSPAPTSTPTPTPTSSFSPTPTPTPIDTGWAPCNDCTFGTQIINDTTGQFLVDINYQKGFAFSGNVMNGVIYFPQLAGWTRGLGGGSLQQIANKHNSAVMLGIGDQYECLVYGPESGHSAGEEALYPDVYVLEAESIADTAGKCLMYAPAINDYETAIEEARGIPGADLIPIVAPHTDLWGFQFGNRQGFVDDGRVTPQEFLDWFDYWVNLIKASNPTIKIYAQVGFGKYDPIAKECQPPLDPEYLLNWREMLAPRVDGIVVMAPQPCQPCPDNPPPGFPCSTDPADNLYYTQYFEAAKTAASMVCTQ